MLAVLGKFIDALYLSCTFEFPGHLRGLLAAAKEDAKGSGDDMRLYTENIAGVPGGAWYIRPYGHGKYQYVLENAAFWVAFSTWANMPAMQLQFKAVTLYEYDADSYLEMVNRVVRFFIGPELLYKCKPSRCDLAVDFQEDGFALPDMADVVTRARARALHFKGSEANTLTLGRRNQAVQAQIYDKSEELAHSEKAWMIDVWKSSGEYRESLAVWRTELRFYREGLRAFEIDTLEDLLASLGDLASYAVDESAGSWLRVCEPTTRQENTSRRSAASWWIAVAAALREGLLSSGRKRKGYDPRPSFNRAVELAGAHMARAASIARIAGLYDVLLPGPFGAQVGELYQSILERKRSSWAEKCNAKTAELRANVWFSGERHHYPIFT